MAPTRTTAVQQPHSAPIPLDRRNPSPWIGTPHVNANSPVTHAVANQPTWRTAPALQKVDWLDVWDRAHPHPIPGGSPLLRAATGRNPHATDRRAAWHGAILAACLIALLLLGGCASGLARMNAGAEAFDPTFDDRWMTVVVVDDGTVAQFCQHENSADGCAKVWRDRGAADPHPTDASRVPPGVRCTIMLNRRLGPETSIAYRSLLAHEVRHCRGWHHVGE